MRRPAAAGGRQGEGRPQLPAGQDLRRAHALAGDRRGAAGSRRCRWIPTHVPVDAGACWACTSGGATRMKAAQLMVRAEAAHQQRAGEDPPAERGAAGSTCASWATRTRRPSCSPGRLQLDPEHIEAAEPLSEVYFKRGEWARLLPILEMLVAQGRAPAQRRSWRCCTTGWPRPPTSWATGTRPCATTSRPTTSTRPTCRRCWIGPSLLYRREQWDEAFKLYQTILVHHREAQKDSDIVEIFHRIGQIKLKTGERAKRSTCSRRPWRSSRATARPWRP